MSRRRLPQDRRRGGIFLAVDEIAEAVGILVGAGHADGEVGGQRHVDVALAAVGVEAAVADGGVEAERIELRLLGDDVDRAARLAAPEQRRGRAFQHLHPLDVRGVADAAIAARGVEAVDQIVAGGVLVAGEAAQREGIEQAAEIVLARDAAGEIERGIEAGEVDLAQRRAGQRLDALRQFLERHVAAILLAQAGDGDGAGIGRRRFGGGDGAAAGGLRLRGRGGDGQEGGGAGEQAACGSRK